MLTANCSEGQFICFYRTAVPPFITFPNKNPPVYLHVHLFFYTFAPAFGSLARVIKREWGAIPLRLTCRRMYQMFLCSSVKAGHWETEKAGCSGVENILYKV